METFTFLIMKIFLQFSTKHLQMPLISFILNVIICKYYTMCKNHLINHTYSEELNVTSFTSLINNKKEIVTMNPGHIKNLLSLSIIIKILTLINRKKLVLYRKNLT